MHLTAKGVKISFMLIYSLNEDLIDEFSCIQYLARPFNHARFSTLH